MIVQDKQLESCVTSYVIEELKADPPKMVCACKETDPGQRIGSARWYEGLKSEVVVIEEKRILESHRVVLTLVVHGMTFG